MSYISISHWGMHNAPSDPDARMHGLKLSPKSKDIIRYFFNSKKPVHILDLCEFFFPNMHVEGQINNAKVHLSLINKNLSSSGKRFVIRSLGYGTQQYQIVSVGSDAPHE